jgi:flagellar motor switch protein FliN/FliY
MTNETTTAASEQTARNFDLLLDIPLEVTVELGRTRLALRELLALGAGSVVELGKLAGEPLDVLVNGKLVARGECVMVNDKFGVRLTDIVSRSERLARLG